MAAVYKTGSVMKVMIYKTGSVMMEIVYRDAGDCTRHRRHVKPVAWH